MISNYEARLATLKQVEQDLQHSIKEAGQEDATVTRQRQHLSMLFNEFIIEYPSESYADNLDAAWWRHCFHTPIDYYRRFLKNPGTPEGRWAFTEVNRLIDSGFGAFSNLIYSLLHIYGHSITMAVQRSILLALGLPAIRGYSGRNASTVEAIIYRCLIFTGDLVRYRSQFNRAFVTDKYSAAWSIYQAARSLEPDHGHAYNQLAVVASLLNEPLLVVYWYLRALCCQYPFAAAQNNLLSFLERDGKECKWGLKSVFLRSVHKVIVGFDGSNDKLLMKAEFKSCEIGICLLILLILRELYHCAEDFDMKSWVSLFIDEIRGEMLDGSDVITFMALVTILRYDGGVIVDDRQRLLNILVNSWSLFDNHETYLALEELAGLNFLEGIRLKFREGKPLLTQLLEQGIKIDGLRLKDECVVLNELHITTPAGQSSPLVLFAPSSSEHPSNYPATSSPISANGPAAKSLDNTIPEEVVLFHGFQRPDHALDEKDISNVQ